VFNGNKSGNVKINSALIFSIILATGIVAVGFTVFQASRERNRMKEELSESSSHVFDASGKILVQYSGTRDIKTLDSAASTLCRRYHLYGIALYAEDSLIFASPSLIGLLRRPGEDVPGSLYQDSIEGKFIKANGLLLFQYIRPVNDVNPASGTILVYTEAGYISQAIRVLWFRNLGRWLIQAVFVIIITLLIIQQSIFTPLKQMVSWMKSARGGNMELPKQKFFSRFLAPLHSEAARLAGAVTEARADVEEEVMPRT